MQAQITIDDKIMFPYLTNLSGLLMEKIIQLNDQTEYTITIVPIETFLDDDDTPMITVEIESAENGVFTKEELIPIIDYMNNTKF